MANFRYINTAIWKDPWFVDLRLTEQHLFIYLLTSSQTNILGIYEISLREMAFDTTIDQEEIKRIFRDRFQPDGKAHYEIGWIVMHNWLKHQKLNGNQLISAINTFNDLPDWLRERLLKTDDSLFIQFESLLKGSKAFETLTIKEKNIIEINIIKNNSAAKAANPVDKSRFLKGRDKLINDKDF